MINHNFYIYLLLQGIPQQPRTGQIAHLIAFLAQSAAAAARLVIDLLFTHWKSTCRLLASSFSHDIRKKGLCT
jgi:hypothetical protein